MNILKMILKDLTLGVLFHLLWISKAIELRTHLAMKVDNNFPPENERCLLDTIDLKNSSLKMDCILPCLKNPACFLACKDQSEQCSLYSAKVSSDWEGSGDSQRECFSYWAERKDLTGTATLTASSSTTPNPTELAGDGFGCSLFGDNKFHSQYNEKEWLLADLVSPKCIDRVMVQTRGAIENNSTEFQAVEVRVGNETGNNGNFTANPLLMRYEGEAELGEVVLFHGQKSLTGRYVSIQITNNDKPLIIMEMKIVGC